MPIDARCPGCDAPARYPNRMAGKVVVCGKCGLPFNVAGPMAVEIDADDDPGRILPVGHRPRTPAPARPPDGDDWPLPIRLLYYSLVLLIPIAFVAGLSLGINLNPGRPASPDAGPDHPADPGPGDLSSLIASATPAYRVALVDFGRISPDDPAVAANEAMLAKADHLYSQGPSEIADACINLSRAMANDGHSVGAGQILEAVAIVLPEGARVPAGGEDCTGVAASYVFFREKGYSHAYGTLSAYHLIHAVRPNYFSGD